MLRDTAIEVLRQLWEIQGKLDRITEKLDEEPKASMDVGKMWVVLAGIGIALLVPPDRQAAILALLK